MCTALQNDTSEIEYPHIEKAPGVCGGSPKIIGTRFTVRSIVTYILKLGMTPEELAYEFPHLKFTVLCRIIMNTLMRFTKRWKKIRKNIGKIS